MNILNLIQGSNITTIGYTSINEKIVQQHLDLLDGVLEYLPITEKTLQEVLEHGIEFQRDWKLNLILNKGKKVFYILDLTKEVKLDEILHKYDMSKYIASFVRELTSKFYHLKNENIEVALVILQSMYSTTSGSINKYYLKYGSSSHYSSELVITMGDDIKIEKNHLDSRVFHIDRIEYIRDFYLNQLTS